MTAVASDLTTTEDPSRRFPNWPTLRDLPALSAVAAQVIQTASAEPFDAVRCGRLMASDAGLSAKLLKLVNSSYYGLRGSVSSVHHASRLLGEVTFRCLALSLSVSASLPRPRRKPFDPDLFWRDNLMRALFAKELADLGRADNPTEVFSGALLQNMGIPLLCQIKPEDSQMVLERHQLGREAFQELETLKYGWNHALFGSWVAEKWCFPKPMILAIRHHHDPVTLRVPDRDGRLIPWTQLSAALPSSATEPSPPWRRAADLIRERFPNAPLGSIAERVDESFAELAGLFQDEGTTTLRLKDRFASV